MGAFIKMSGINQKPENTGEHAGLGGNRAKWSQSFDEVGGWDTEAAQKVHDLEAGLITDWLLNEPLPEPLTILELGCGSGSLGLKVAERLLDSGIDLTYHLTDFLPQCIELAEEKRAGFSRPERIKISPLDVYRIEEEFEPGSIPVIISTGYAAAAAYLKAVPKVARVLSENGLLICDFINHLAPLTALRNPGAAWRLYRETVTTPPAERGITYHCGRVGLAQFFALSGLELIRLKALRLRRNPLLAMFYKK